MWGVVLTLEQKDILPTNTSPMPSFVMLVLKHFILLDAVLNGFASLWVFIASIQKYD